VPKSNEIDRGDQRRKIEELVLGKKGRERIKSDLKETVAKGRKKQKRMGEKVAPPGGGKNKWKN